MYVGRSDKLFSLEKYDGEANQAYGIGETSYADTETIDCRRLDSFNLEPGERRVLLKVDVQGHEEESTRRCIRGSFNGRCRNYRVFLCQ